ncbi:MAG TPA: phosphotransferase [Candidatus Binatia bacterium]|nr:phosphotransferase [Candidatus Binatia bacterium]
MGFVELSEAEQTALLAGLAHRALRAWRFEEAELGLIKYRENAVFRVTPAGGDRNVLRVHRPAYRTDDEIRSEAAWIRALGASGVETPAMLPAENGDVLSIASHEGVPEPRQCDLLAWVDGAPVGTLEGGVALDDCGLRELYATIGTIAARIHAHGLEWQRPAGFARPSWSAETLVGDSPTFGRFWELADLDPDLRALLLAARDRARERLDALGPANELIHGDLVPDNVLTADAAIRVIDFDDCGWSWFGFELATSLFPLRLLGGFEPALAGYLEGYRAVRAFPQHQLEELPTLLVARGLSYLGWTVGRPEIAAQRPLVPFLAHAMGEMARDYVAGARAG